MALKDTWKDKVDGIDDVLASDINSIARSAIQSEEKIAKQETTISGKVDKITKTWQAYTTDDNGNTVPKKLAAKPADGGVVLYNAGGILKTNAPVADLDCVNKKTMDDGLAVKLDALTNGDHNTAWLYGNSWDGKYQLFKTSPHGTVGQILLYGDVTKTAKEKPKGTIGVNMPEQPYQATPKQYVDNKFRDLQQGVYNALGVLYTFESVKLGSPYNEIPVGALSIAYLESIGGVNVYSHATGERVFVGTTDIVAIHIYDANNDRLSTYDPTAPQYIELPEGAVAIVFEYREPTVSVWDTLEIDASIKYQIKVGA